MKGESGNEPIARATIREKTDNYFFSGVVNIFLTSYITKVADADPMPDTKPTETKSRTSSITFLRQKVI